MTDKSIKNPIPGCCLGMTLTVEMPEGLEHEVDSEVEKGRYQNNRSWCGTQSAGCWRSANSWSNATSPKKPGSRSGRHENRTDPTPWNKSGKNSIWSRFGLLAIEAAGPGIPQGCPSSLSTLRPSSSTNPFSPKRFITASALASDSSTCLKTSSTESEFSTANKTSSSW